MRASKLGVSHSLIPTFTTKRPDRSLDCLDADRIAAIVASIRGRAKLGLQASSRLSKLVRTLNFSRRRFVIEEVTQYEFVKDTVVVAIHMIKLRMEGVGERGDPLFKEVIIWAIGVRRLEKVAEVIIR